MRDAGRCRDCRFWNGSATRPAPCFKIKGQSGRYYEIDRDRAAFEAASPDDRGPFLMTGPDFGCMLFAAGRPRWWGDDGDADHPDDLPVRA